MEIANSVAEPDMQHSADRTGLFQSQVPGTYKAALERESVKLLQVLRKCLAPYTPKMRKSGKTETENSLLA